MSIFINETESVFLLVLWVIIEYFFLQRNKFEKLFTGECYPKGYTVDVTAESLINPCTTGAALEAKHDFTVTDTEIQKVY